MADHGTEAGYRAHRRRKQPACGRCMEGHRKYVAERRLALQKKGKDA